MRKQVFIATLAFLFMVAFPALSLAGEVDIYTVREEDMSPMELRKRALAEGFARAVADETQAVLGGALDANRLEALRLYFVDHAKTYIQGYNILSSEEFEDGLRMILDVRVNRRTLREGLTRLGFHETVKTLQPASVAWPEDLTEEELVKMHFLVTMMGLTLQDGVYPTLAMERGPENTYRGTLLADGRDWSFSDKDMSVVWTNLWSMYFSRPQDGVTGPERQSLIISGWFTPDGVLEFDGVLKGWDYAVENTRLVEMDIQPGGVGATWDMNILDSKRLAMLLNSFLPQRGLSFQLQRRDGQ